jgi:hypothetical protein
VITIYAADGTTVLAGPSNDLDFGEILISPALTAAQAGTVYVVITPSTFVDGSDEPDADNDPYNAIISIQ